MGKLTRILRKLENEPLLAEARFAEKIFSVLDDRGIEQALQANMQKDEDEDDEEKAQRDEDKKPPRRRNREKSQKDDDEDERREKPKSSLVSNGIGQLNIHGALTYRPTMFEGLCGGASYVRLVEQTQQMADEGARIIVMDVDSGGGEAYACFENAMEIRRIADENDIELVAYVDGMAASAAYALVSIADEIVLNPDAEAGSIGVVVSLVNTSEAERQAGIQRTFITAGEDKVPFNEDGQFTESFLGDVQARVDRLYDNFVAHVAANRSEMTERDIRNTEARVFSSEDAMDLGLVDSVATRREFTEYIRMLNITRRF